MVKCWAFQARSKGLSAEIDLCGASRSWLVCWQVCLFVGVRSQLVCLSLSKGGVQQSAFPLLHYFHHSPNTHNSVEWQGAWLSASGNLLLSIRPAPWKPYRSEGSLLRVCSWEQAHHWATAAPLVSGDLCTSENALTSMHETSNLIDISQTPSLINQSCCKYPQAMASVAMLACPCAPS